MNPHSGNARIARLVLGGAVAGSITGFLAPWEVSVLVGWCVGALVLVAGALRTITRADAPLTRAVATREDGSRVVADVTVVGACLSSLVGVAFLLAYGGSLPTTVLAVVTVVLSWLVVQTLFTFRYAHAYWSVPPGGVDFGEDEAPDFRDFAYLAFTIGMTYQVSDTTLTTKELRRAALPHALLSFVFGTAIIAVTINVVASLAR